MKKWFIVLLVVFIIIVIISSFLVFKKTTNIEKIIDKQESCFNTGKCPTNTNCFYEDRYNYKTHQRELIYSECLKQCENEDENNCPEGSRCGLMPVKDVWPSNFLNRTIDYLCVNEQQLNESIKKTIIDKDIRDKFSKKQFHFNGDINDSQTKEYYFTTSENTLEVEMVLIYYGGCMDLHIFDTKGRHIGENWGPPGSLDKPSIPNVEYHRKPCVQSIIKLNDPLPDTYQVKIFASETYGDNENFDVLVEEVYEI